MSSLTIKSKIKAVLSVLTALSFASVLEAKEMKLSSSYSDHHYSVGARAGFLGGVPQTGLEAMYSLSSSLELGLYHTQGEIDLKEDISAHKNSRVEKLDVTGSMTKFHARLFPFQASSFYVAAALGSRVYKSDVEVRSKSNQNSYIYFDTVSRSQTINFGVGNLWKFRNGLQIGADWIDLALPVSSEYSSKTERGSDFSLRGDYWDKKVENLSRKLGNAYSFSMTFNIGYGF